MPPPARAHARILALWLCSRAATALTVADLPVAARAVAIDGLEPPGLYVYEVDDDAWWRAATAEQNPYGARLWPGAVAAAARVSALPAVRAGGARVLELGCGVCGLFRDARARRPPRTR